MRSKRQPAPVPRTYLQMAVIENSCIALNDFLQRHDVVSVTSHVKVYYKSRETFYPENLTEWHVLYKVREEPLCQIR